MNTNIFFKFTPGHLEILKSLNKNEIILWQWYLLQDPWGDRQIELIPEIVERQTGLSRYKYYRARAKLVQKKLICVEERNTIAFVSRYSPVLPTKQLDSNKDNSFEIPVAKSAPLLQNLQPSGKNCNSSGEICNSSCKNCNSSGEICNSSCKNCNSQELEVNQGKGSGSLQTLQTNQTHPYPPEGSTDAKEKLQDLEEQQESSNNAQADSDKYLKKSSAAATQVSSTSTVLSSSESEMKEYLQNKDFVRYLFNINPQIRNLVGFLYHVQPEVGISNFELYKTQYDANQEAKDQEALAKWGKHIDGGRTDWENHPYKNRWIQSFQAIFKQYGVETMEQFTKGYNKITDSEALGGTWRQRRQFMTWMIDHEYVIRPE